MKTPLYDEHVKLKGHIVDFAGWDMPVYYSSILDEHHNTRNNAGLFDICHMGEIYVRGKDALPFLQKALSRNLHSLAVGKVNLSVMCNESGGSIDDLTVYKFSDEKFMLVVNASNIKKDYAFLVSVKDKYDFDVSVEDKSKETAKLDLQGPHSEKILQKLTDCKLSEINYYAFKEADVLGVQTIVSRTGYTGEDGFEIYFDADKACLIWNELLEAGKEFSLLPVGLGARDSLRLESGMNLYGHELHDDVSPLHCRYSWVTDLTKDFEGKEAVLRRKENDNQKLIGFEMADRAIPRNGYKIFNDSCEAVGAVSSGTFSPTMHKGIGLGFVPKEFAKEGSTLNIEIRSNLHKAKIIKLPFYRRS